MEIGIVRILLVDDDEDDYVITRDLLAQIKGWHFELVWISGYAAARELIARCEHDVYLLDYHLGERSGLDLLREALAYGCKAPLILLTGQGDQEIDIEAMRAGAADYLIKGQITAPLLERSIRYALKRAQTLQALRESEERYALALRGTQDGLWDWNLITNEIYFSPQWKGMLGYREDEIGANPQEWFNRVHPEDLPRLKGEIDAYLEELTSHYENEHRMWNKDGSCRWMLSRGMAVRNAQGKALRLTGSQTDITERKQMEEQLMRDAYHDTLTGLPNQALFMDCLRRAMARIKRRESDLFAVLFLDLDHFKKINDSLGHLFGDQLLIAIARKLELCLRPGDMVARFGGDEFTLLLDEIQDLREATQIADRIHKELSMPLYINGEIIHAKASIGIALSGPEYEHPEDLLRDTDTAMYRAKARGKGCHEVFNRTLHRRTAKSDSLAQDLRWAMEREEFRVHYQPIVSVRSGEVTGVEALARWQHPERGLLLPEEFISLAEETGLIIALGEWVLHTACAQNKAWHDAGHTQLRMAVNCSARQFHDQNLPELIKKVLEETGLPARALDLEITESFAIPNLECGLTTLSELNAMEVKISLDDFGTGYSSLSYLKHFLIDTIKIDQLFVRDMTVNADNAAITSAIIAMAHSLKMRVIAEGVETEEQLGFLRAWQCDEVQGFLCSRPMPAEGVTSLLREGWSVTFADDSPLIVKEQR